MVHKRRVMVFAIVIISLLILAPSASAKISDFWGKVRAGITGHATSQSVTLNVSVGNTAPNIIYILVSSSVNPTEDSTTTISFNFTAWDPDGFGNLDAKGGKANFTKTGEAVRSNSSCRQIGTYALYYANYTCEIQLWYFDASGNWNITALVNDSSNAIAQNRSWNFTWNQLSAFTTHPAALTWASLSPGVANQTSNNDPLVMNNTGNKNVTEIQLNATNLRGETDPMKAIWAANMTMALLTSGSNIECGVDTNQSSILSPSAFVNVTNATLPVGNHSVSGVGNRGLYACMRVVGSELSSQSYSTWNESAWTIKTM